MLIQTRNNTSDQRENIMLRINDKKSFVGLLGV